MHWSSISGGAVDESTPAIPAASALDQVAKINLENRVEREAPQLANLVRQAGISLEKAGLSNHRAKVSLVLDISSSMSSSYRKGLVQQFAQRILALSCKFGDDSEIDVFLFGEHVHQTKPMGLNSCKTYVQQAAKFHPLECDTRYGRAMGAVRRFYFPDAGGKERLTPHKSAMPVYVMFVIDGTTSDKPLTERQLRWASNEPMFRKFMGIGKGKKAKLGKYKLFLRNSYCDFPFLEKLDDLDGRLIDNANFFSVASPDEYLDAELYDLLMDEYPSWLKLVKQKGLLA